MTLVEFLLARIAEDRVEWGGDALDPEQKWTDCLHDRMLAECEAKRRIVTPHVDGHRCEWGDWYQPHECVANILRLLATPYADHPEYDADWTPRT